MQADITFEQPLNERIRTCLRIEQLMERCEHRMNGDTVWDTHAALMTMIEVVSLAARGDLKIELLKELKRQVANLDRLTQYPGVDRDRLKDVVANHHRLIESLDNIAVQPDAHIKDNDFINSIKQRTSIPGGTCDFDLPAYHYWLARPAAERQAALRAWIEPLTDIRAAVVNILALIRQSAEPAPAQASGGFYQQSLDSEHPYQMLRIRVPAEAGHYPEISAGKQRFTVRFRDTGDLSQRAGQVNEDVDFHLACCAL